MEPNENIISLCMCTGNVGWPWRRLADLKDGKFVPFEVDNDLPYEYENRKSFPRLRPGEEAYIKVGDIGVVAWHDEPNINDSTKVFCCLTPIDKEVIKVFRTKAESKEDVIEELKKGMPFGDSDNDILYVFNTGIGRLQGILCQKGDLKVAGDKYILQPTVKSLSVYDVSPSDIIVLDNIPYECRNMAYCEVLDKSSLDFPVTRAHTKSVGEIIKDIVLEEAFTWGNYSKYAKEISQQGKLTNASLHTLKSFIQRIDTSNLYERVKSELSCSYEEAKQWTNRVVNRADEYFSGEELSGDVIEALLWNSKNLREKCMDIGAEMWRQENADSIKAAQEKISELDNQCKERQTQINTAEQLIEKKISRRMFSSILLRRMMISPHSTQDTRLLWAFAATEALPGTCLSGERKHFIAPMRSIPIRIVYHSLKATFRMLVFRMKASERWRRYFIRPMSISFLCC